MDTLLPPTREAAMRAAEALTTKAKRCPSWEAAMRYAAEAARLRTLARRMA